MSLLPRVLVCAEPRWPHLNPIFDEVSNWLKTHHVSHAVLPAFDTALTPDHNLNGVELVLGFGGMKFTAAEMDRMPQLKSIVSCVSGVDGIDLDEATRRGIVVAHAPTPENFRGMAEAAVMLMLHLFHALDDSRSAMAPGSKRPHPLKARSIEGKVVGIVGWGKISQMVATLIATWGVQIVVYSRRGGAAGLPDFVQLRGLDALMSESDMVCVFTGSEPGQPPVVSSTMIQSMKPSSYFMNLSRGGAVDEQALIAALQNGRIAGAALDVFQEEPLPAESPLRNCSNVILTPHRVGHTSESDDSLVVAARDNVAALLAGKVPPYVKNTRVLKRQPMPA